jgi:uncharacterized protein YukE
MTADRTTALVSSSPPWIGNLSGLSAFADALDEYATTLKRVAGTLDDKVTKMTNDVQWQGNGGDAFRSAWEKDSDEARQIASTATGIGTIVHDLTRQLTSIENSLQDDAKAARAQGVQIGPELQPLGAATSYDDSYNAAKQQALAAQTTAADEIMHYTNTWSPAAEANFWASTIVGMGGTAAALAVLNVFRLPPLTTTLTTSGAAFGEVGMSMGAAIGLEAAVPIVAFGVGNLALNLMEGHGLSSFADTGHAYQHLWDDTLGKLF